MADYTLRDLEVSAEEVIMRKIKNINFAKTILWLALKFEKDDFVYANELAKVLKTTYTRAYQILTHFVDLGLLYHKKMSSNMVCFYPTKNDGKIVIEKYIKFAKRTLGIK